jgi:aspartate/methionine/tyrosine aminotransferase
MYGASKDFGGGGLRLGFLITRNALLWKTTRRLALFTWVTKFSAAFFARFLATEAAVDEYLRVYRARLRESYTSAARMLRKYNVPFDAANSGLFVFVKLTRWLVYFDGTDAEESRELKLCRFLIQSAGVFLSMGEVNFFFPFLSTGRAA